MGGLHWRKKGGGKDAGGSSARKQVVLTAAQLTELESYIQDMEAKCAQFQVNTIPAQFQVSCSCACGHINEFAYQLTELERYIQDMEANHLICGPLSSHNFSLSPYLSLALGYSAVRLPLLHCLPLPPKAVVAHKALAEAAIRGQLEAQLILSVLTLLLPSTPTPSANPAFPRSQTVVAHKAAAEAAMRGELQGLAAGVEGERAARESALDALMTDFESRVCVGGEGGFVGRVSLEMTPVALVADFESRVCVGRGGGEDERESLPASLHPHLPARPSPQSPPQLQPPPPNQTPSARLPPPSSARSSLPTITSSAAAAPTEPDSISQPSTLAPPSLPSSLTSSLRSSVRPALPSSLSTSLTTFVSSSSEIEAFAQRARAAALAAASAAAGRGGAGAAAGAAGGATFAALPGVSAGGGDFPGMAEAGGMMAYPGGPHTSLYDYMELQRQLAEEQQKNLVVQQLAAEKAWMEAALMRFLQMKRQHEEEVAQLLAKHEEEVAQLMAKVSRGGPVGCGSAACVRVACG
ncbi:unnamed protein product [Closterium sp. Naga37s-1]|nr:unnamed protein product [Closterium sp. Naga37s-1]